MLEVVAPENAVIDNIKVIEGQPIQSGQVVIILNKLILESEGQGKQQAFINSNTLDKVFLVHGHDEAAVQQVARSLEKLGLEVIILHEQINEGKTIIEKFEHFSKKTGFAVVLMTPDDVGGVNSQNLSHRARQNVVLELGYFVGLFGRDRVFILKKENVEIPSDYMGVVYTSMDVNGGWKLSLAKEIHNAGLLIDLSKVVLM
ncbi:nucleotide-binding protein [Rheinheimera sp. YQF-2]|uniref:Nucleotide-binding protein n=1 Tax=Rheinheimera lutimaris TaxID=2740584 RepID=A0A7Y5EIB3_9GAMM|nr:nucleotide-binding protein [Rheinheimera lutimaris]